MPIWAKVDGVTPNLEPMRLKDAVDRMERIAQLRRMQIERNEDARIQRFSLKAALELEGKYKVQLLPSYACVDRHPVLSHQRSRRNRLQ